MKKTSLVLASIVLAGAVSAKEAVYSRDLYSPETHPVTPLVISLADPLQLPKANYNVKGLRWDIFYGNNFTMTGLDLGLVGRVNDAFTGVALTVANWVESDVAGLQVGGVFNVDLGNVSGVQLGGLVNYDRGILAGLQLAPLNFNGGFSGVQLAGLNWEKGVCTGLAIGAGNVAVSEFHGCSIGVVNYTERSSGLQLGAVNVAGETGYGVQIGCFNCAPRFTGLQIGLLNVIGNAAIPVLPVMNGNF